MTESDQFRCVKLVLFCMKKITLILLNVKDLTLHVVLHLDLQY